MEIIESIKHRAACIAADLRPEGKSNVEEWEEYGINVALKLVAEMRESPAKESVQTPDVMDMLNTLMSGYNDLQAEVLALKSERSRYVDMKCTPDMPVNDNTHIPANASELISSRMEFLTYGHPANHPVSKIFTLLSGINWVALRGQKLTLLNMIDRLGQDPCETSDALNGIVHIIGYLQDFAVDCMGKSEKEVFGDNAPAKPIDTNP